LSLNYVNTAHDIQSVPRSKHSPSRF